MAAQELNLEDPRVAASRYGACLELTILDNNPQRSLIRSNGNAPEPVFPLSVMCQLFIDSIDIKLDFHDISVIQNWDPVLLMHLLDGNKSYSPDTEFPGMFHCPFKSKLIVYQI